MDFYTKMAVHLFGKKGDSNNPHVEQAKQPTKGVWNDGINQGKQFMWQNNSPTLNSSVAEMGSMGVPQTHHGGLRSRIQGNKQRQYALLKNNILKGLLKNGQI